MVRFKIISLYIYKYLRLKAQNIRPNESRDHYNQNGNLVYSPRCGFCFETDFQLWGLKLTISIYIMNVTFRWNLLLVSLFLLMIVAVFHSQVYWQSSLLYRRGSKGSQHSQLTTYKKYRKSYTTSFAYFLLPSSCVFWSRCGSRCHHCASQTRCFFNIFRFSADMKSREYYYLGWNLPSS